MRTQDSRRLRATGPPLETALRQSLRGEPEPLAVIGQQFYHCPPAAAEDEQTAGEWICVQLLPAKLRDGIDPLTSVYRLDRNQNAELRCDLYQEAISHNTRLRLARSEAEAPFNWIRSFPRLPSISSVHSGTDCACGVTNSTKVACCGTAPVAGMRRFRSSHATCNSRAVRFIPSFRATSTAADQSSAGMRAFPLRLVLHSPKRTLASSRLTMGALLRGRVFLLAGKPSGRTTLTVIDRILHTPLPKTHGGGGGNGHIGAIPLGTRLGGGQIRLGLSERDSVVLGIDTGQHVAGFHVTL